MNDRRLRALPVLPLAVVGLVVIVCHVLPGVDVIPYRGGERLVEVFHHGRFDALQLVARRPARVCAPLTPIRLTLTLSGPSQAIVAAGGIEHRTLLEVAPQSLPLILETERCVDVRGDRAVRLHRMRFERLVSPDWSLLAATLLALIAAGAVAFFLAGIRAWLLVCGASLAALGLLLFGWSGFVLSTLIRRWAPSAVVVLLLGLFFVVLLLSRRSAAQRPALEAASTRLALIFGGLTLASCLAQVLLFQQPMIESDPWAYWDIGGRFRDALLPVRGPDSLADALLLLRPLLVLPLTGLLYAFARAISDHPSTVYCLHALAMAGAVFFLTLAAFRVGGAMLAWITGALATAYPTFAIVCGIVQPEPFILLCWTFALDRLLVARKLSSLRCYGVAGLTFSIGLALHPQGLWFLLVAGVLALLPYSKVLLARRSRAAFGAFALGVLPPLLLTAVGETYARPTTHVLAERYGFWAYTARYPLGFWLFIDDDGWQGSVRLSETRFGRGFDAIERNAASRLIYTLRFIFDNAGAALRTVLRNHHRLFHEPDNPFHRTWILPYNWQVPWHRALVVLFLLATPLFFARRAHFALLPFALLSLTYPAYHIFNKYALPAAPFLLLGSALALERLASDRSRWMIGSLCLAALGTLLSPAGLALHGIPPVIARLLLLSLYYGGLTAAFLFAYHIWAQGRAARMATAIAGAILLATSAAASWGNPSWRAFDLPLDRPAEHEVVIGEAGLRKLDAAREAYLVLDLELSSGDPGDLRLEFGSGLVVPGGELTPTMPVFPLASIRGHRDPRTFKQWWRMPWRSAMASNGRVALRVSGSKDARLGADLATPDARGVYRGLSLGEWPNLSVYRLMHDGEYRFAVRQQLSGAGYASRWDGRDLPGSLRIRFLILDDDTGGAVWETAPAPASRVVTAIWAEAGRQARADLILPSGQLLLDFENPRPVSGPAGEVRVHLTGEYEGWYMVRTRAMPGKPLRLRVRLRHEMSGFWRYFRPQIRPEHPPLPLDWAGIRYVPPARIIEVRESPHWRPVMVF